MDSLPIEPRHRDVASWPEGGGKITGDFDEFDHCADEACEHTEKVDCCNFLQIFNFSKRLQHFVKVCKFLAGSFSAAPKPIFASKYALGKIFQALQNLHTFAPLLQI